MNGRVVFSQDVDFLEIATGWTAEARPFADVIFATQLGVTIGQAIGDLQLMAELLDPEEIRHRTEWIPLS